jgi:manganese-dependent inorganic pyrophosphatase
MMDNIVTSYVDPDTDGISCAIGFAKLARHQGRGPYVPVFAGQLNQETLLALTWLNLEHPTPMAVFDAAQSIVLVDTHHVRQLPSGFPCDKVVEIIDHHPHGDLDAFPNARVYNERVGAAATLVAERFFDNGINLDDGTAALLACGILSNTLDFMAPSTTERDRQAYERLAYESPLQTELRTAISLSREAFLQGTTREIVNRDSKIFSTPHGLVFLSQLEAAGAASLLGRGDLVEELRRATQKEGARFGLLNLVDLSLGGSVLVATENAVWEFLSSVPLRLTEFHVGWADELLLRKTHLVPALMKT